ncbi:MAG: hypothetical protein R3F30_14650 [Planctomycetota bacterium]
MRACDDERLAEWFLGPGGEPPALDDEGRLDLDALDLGRFEARARILHPIWEDLSLAGDDAPWDECWDPRWGRGRPRASFPARGLKWHDLAEERGLDFGTATTLADLASTFVGGRWPRRLCGPEDGLLELDCLHHLERLLRPYAGDGCELHYPASRTTDGRPRCFEGGPGDALRLLDGPGLTGSPTLWADRGRRWVLLSHPDLAWTLCAGPQALVDDLLVDKPLDGVVLEGVARLG